MSSYEAGFGGRPAEEPWPGRRQLDELTGAELRAQLAWWFPGPDGHLTGPDAATVLPLDASAAAADGSVEFPDGRYLLHATFTLADGTRMDGHVTFVPGDAGTPADREPTLCTPRGQVPLWLGAVAATDAQLAAYLGAVGKSRVETFPLRWEASLHPPNAPLRSTLDGFAAWRDGRIASA